MKLLPDIILPGIILLILDAIYISFISDSFQLQIISVQRVTMKIRILGAIICYALLIFGLYYFILKDHRSVCEATILGIVIYGVYEATNYATLKKWSLKFLILDTLWGGALMGLTTYLTYKLVPKLTK
jgi:uncharacterized membrane protein